MRSLKRRPDDSSAAPFGEQSFARQLLLSLGFALLPAIAVGAQAPYVESIEVRVANLDVVVTDSSGKRIYGLRREDFEIRENGRVQPITNFYEVTPEQVAKLHASPAPAPATPAQATQAPLPLTRKVIILIDEGSIEPHRRQQLLDSLQIFLDKTLTPRDEVMIATWRRGLHIPLPFTSDAAAIKRSIETIRKDVPIESITFARQRDEVEKRVQMEIELVRMKIEPVEWGHAAAVGHVRVFSDQIRTRTRELARGIEALMKILAGVEAKKSFVFVGGSFPSFPGREYFAYVDATIGPMMGRQQPTAPAESAAGNESDLQASIARTANTYGITFYGISAATDWDTSSVSNRDAKERLHDVEFSAFTNTASALQAVSVETGGVAMVGGTNFLGALATVANDMSAFYSLGYRPTKGSGPANITVQVKRPGLRVRARANTVKQTVDEEVSARVVGNLLYPSPRSDFAISAKAGAPKQQGRNLYAMPIEVTIPADAIVLLPADTRLKGGFSVFVGGKNVHGAVSDVTQKRQDIDVPVSERDALAGKHWTFEVSVLVRPDQDSLTVGVMDDVSKAVGFANVSIQPKG